MHTLSKDTIAYNIGWDAAMYGLHFFEDWPVELRIGWAAARKAHHTPKKSDKFIRKWVQLRVGAYKRGKTFSEGVTPNYLRMINMGFCPILLKPFTYGKGADTDWSVDRIDNDRGYERQNLISMSTRVNSAKAALSYQEINELINRSKCIHGLNHAASMNLWTTISIFCRSENDDISDEDNYYIGAPVAPDAPLNAIMSLQLLISISIESGQLGQFQSLVATASKRSGNFKLMKKMMKRLCRFQAADITWPFMMHRVWCNDRNRQNYKLWLRGLRPAYWDVLSNLAIETIKGANEMGLKNNLEKWAI